VRPAAELLPEVYAELRHLAAALTRQLRPGQTLQPTALVHEAYLRLMRHQDPAGRGAATSSGRRPGRCARSSSSRRGARAAASAAAAPTASSCPRTWP